MSWHMQHLSIDNSNVLIDLLRAIPWHKSSSQPFSRFSDSKLSSMVVNTLLLAMATCGGPPNDEIKHNNQPMYSIGDGGRLCDEIWPQRNVWGGKFHVIWGGEWGNKKTKKINQIVVLGGRRTTILHNNQPKTCRYDGGGIKQDARLDGDVRGARSHRFWGDRVGRRLKNELK